VNLVHNDVLSPKGATFIAQKETGQEDTEFMAGSDPWFRPIHSRVGPDGALYVVDWYNQAVVHNDTRGPAHGAHNAATRPDRDHHFARLWRVQHKQAKPMPVESLGGKESSVWLQALESENGWRRMTAHRLLTERGGEAEVQVLAAMLQNKQGNPITRMHALYLLRNLGRLETRFWASALEDSEPILRKNALRLIAEREDDNAIPETATLLPLTKDPDPRAQLYSFLALGSYKPSSDIARAVVAAWPDLADAYLQSAAVGCAAPDPLLFVAAAFQAPDPALVTDFVKHVTRVLANKQDPDLAARLIGLLAQQPASAGPTKQAALEMLAGTLRADVKVAWNSSLQSSFTALLKDNSSGVSDAALPLIARWDREATLAGALQPVIERLRAKLLEPNLPDGQRAQAVVNLTGVRNLDPGIVPTIAALLGSSASVSLQQKSIEALGNTGDPNAGRELVAAYGRVPDELHEPVFGQLIKRSDWALLLVQTLADGKVSWALLGPANLHRLRTHGDAAVAARANQVIDARRGPVQKQKDTLIAQFRPTIEPLGGNLELGHSLFTTNCAVCHKFKDEGRDLAPNLTGMGAHGAADLLVHILDPNRLVEPNFYSTSIETKDGLSYDGIIARENSAEVVLRNASGDYTLRTDNIQSRRATGLSLMPEGFEGLGGEGLRDLLSFLCADEQRFRILDLGRAFTVNTGKGVYTAPENTTDAPDFTKFGLVHVDQVPFDLVSPNKIVANAIVLKGGEGYAKTLSQRVEFNVGLAAQRLHFLGGIGGWAWPFGGDETKDLPVMRVVLHFTGGATEEMILRNGVEFADWIGPHDVPGSKGVPELAKRGQVRYFSKDVKGRGVIEKIVLESFDNSVAPTIMGITAEMSDAKPGQLSSLAAPAKGALRTLIVGAGSSHDFKRWFLEEDSKTLAAGGLAQVSVTDKPEEASHFVELDVLFLANNAPFPRPAMRDAILDFANAGKGLLLVHPALWYNWADWPEYNRLLCGGGSRGHDALAEFEVTVTEPNHPLMQGVPAKFKVRDELYWFEPDPQGTPIQVLATAHSPSKNQTFPMVFIVQHPKARIVGIALGHDGATHEDPAYQRLLRNALRWSGTNQSVQTR
jgi:putative heme-binding domain-containing protein